MKTRNVGFILFVGLSLIVFSGPARSLVKLSVENDSYTHVILIPVISLLLIYMERRRIFADVHHCIGTGAIMLGAGILSFYLGRGGVFSLGRTGNLSLMTLSLFLVWVAGFVLFYGIKASRAAAFPLLFLLLMIPLPNFLLARIVLALQQGSAETLGAIYRIAGVPFLRQGFVFSLPGVNIEIARQCSGIRSSIALLITTLLAGHFFLRSAWKKASLCLFILPIVVLKNALRIASISLLSVYVNRGFLSGNLHHYGGIPFSIISVAMLIPFLWLLQRSEKPFQGTARPAGPALQERSVAR